MKINARKLVSLFLVCAMIFPLGAFNVSAAEQPVTIQLDGRQLVFDVEPEIFNGYTMVPIGQIIEYLTGKSADWNPNTKTMTFNAYGSTVIHTVGENRISIDGVERDYPTSSMIVNDRTLVPVRMMADASKCEIGWDGNTKTVSITSPHDVYTSSPSPQQPSQSTEVRIETVRDVSSNMRVGNTCNATIVATSGATRAWLNTTRRGDFAETTQYQTDSIGRRLFYLSWVPQTGGSQTITAVVENEHGTKDTMRFDVHVSGGDQSVRIESLSTSPSHIKAGSRMNITVTTNTMADCVWYEFGDQTGSRNYDYDEYNNGRREFNLSFDLDSYDDRTDTLYVYARDRSGNEDSKSTRISVESDESSASIYKVDASSTDISIGDSVTIDVTVSSDVTDVELKDNDGVSLNGEYYSSSGSRSKVFRIYDYQPQTAGTKKVTIRAFGNNSDSKSLNIHVNGDAETKINNIDCPSDVQVGDSFTINIYTVMGVTPSVRLSWDSDERLDYSVGDADVGAGQMVIPVDVTISNPGTYRITVSLKGANGSDRANVTVNAAQLER